MTHRPPRSGRAGALLDLLVLSVGVQWAEMRANPLVLVLGVVQPAVLLVVTLTPRPDAPAADATRVAIGVLLTSFWAATVWTAAGILRRERALGTLARLLAGVRDPRLVVLSKALGASVVSAACVTATVALVLAGLRQPVRVPAVPWLLLGAVLVLLSGSAVGLLVGGLFVLSRYGLQLSSALMYPVFLLGGMLVPLQFLPGWLRPLSALVSLRWLRDYFVAAATGEPDLRAALLAAALTAAYAVGGVVLFARVTDRARRQGTLELL